MSTNRWNYSIINVLLLKLSYSEIFLDVEHESGWDHGGYEELANIPEWTNIRITGN